MVIEYFCGEDHILFMDSCNKYFCVYVSVEFDTILYVRIGRKSLFLYHSANTIGANLVGWRTNFSAGECGSFPFIDYPFNKGINCQKTKKEDFQLSV